MTAQFIVVDVVEGDSEVEAFLDEIEEVERLLEWSSLSLEPPLAAVSQQEELLKT